MIPELGHFALIIAFCMALAGGPLALLGAQQQLLKLLAHER